MRRHYLWFPPLLAAVISFAFPVEPDRSEGQFLTEIRQLTFEGKRAGEGYFSRDGRHLIFQSEREPDNPFYQIYLLDLLTGDTRRLSPGLGKTTCGWIHPDGTRALFASTHHDPQARAKQEAELAERASGTTRRYAWDYDEEYEIYTVELESGELTRLTEARGYDAEASWSPDGRWIVFASNRHAYSSPLPPGDEARFQTDPSYLIDLYRMDADGQNVRRLTVSPGYDGGPFFSPDGGRIVWRRFSEDGATAEIFTMNAQGEEERQITRLNALSWAPFYHPSGDYLIFATNLHGFSNFELYLVDSEGRRDPVRVTFTEGFDGLPAFSPDGTLLAWTSNRTSSGQSQIFMARWNHEAARSLLALDPVSGTAPEIREADLRRHVEQLASPEMEGRLTGTPGERKAAESIAGYLEGLGLEPAGEEGTFLQSFEFTAGVSLGPANRLVIHGATPPPLEWRVDQDWRPLAFSQTGHFPPAPVAFAGYGLVVPAESGKTDYDSYTHLDVEDKWVLVFRYLPEGLSPEERQRFSRYSSLRYKAMVARERGALGLLVASGPNSRVENQLVELVSDASLAGTSLGALSVTDSLAQSLLSSAGRNLEEVQSQLDSGQPLLGFDLPGVRLEATVDIQKEKRRGYNVLARLRAREMPSENGVVLGAHLDHLGRGRGPDSLARDWEKEEIHYGADDNASGVAALLEIAQQLVHLKQQGRLPMNRDLWLGAWSGEELGLLGSSHFVSSLEHHPVAYLNLDMVGRLREHLVLQGVGSSPAWPGLIERGNIPVGLPIVLQSDTYLPTDATSFYLKQVPILSAFTGSHEDYHTPRDRPEKLNYPGLEKITRLMSLITQSLLASEEAPEYRQVERPESLGRRAHLRAYLGTIPDYVETPQGLKLAGVVHGGPAQQAGLQAGDVIVELAGRKIENIYDYTYAIEALKIGEPVSIVVLRGQKRLQLEITPGSRE